MGTVWMGMVYDWWVSMVLGDGFDGVEIGVSG